MQAQPALAGTDEHADLRSPLLLGPGAPAQPRSQIPRLSPSLALGPCTSRLAPLVQPSSLKG